MNKIGFIGVLILLLLMASCSSDSDDQADLLGIWNLDELRVICIDDTESQELKANNGCYDVDEMKICFFLNFMEGGTGRATITVDGAEEGSGFTYTQNGNQVTVCDDSNECEVFQLNNNKLTLPANGDCEESFIFVKD